MGEAHFPRPEGRESSAKIPTQGCLSQAPLLPTDHAGPLPAWPPHLTVPARLQAAAIHSLLTVGALEPGRAVADVGRVRVCASHTQAAIEAGSIRTCHPAHLTPQSVEPSGTGTFEGSRGLLRRGKRTSERVSREQNPNPPSCLNQGGLLLVRSYLPVFGGPPLTAPHPISSPPQAVISRSRRQGALGTPGG